MWAPDGVDAPAPPPARRRNVTKPLAGGVAVLVGLGLLGAVVVSSSGGGGDDGPSVTADTTPKGPDAKAVLAAAPGATQSAGSARVRTSTRSFEGGSASKVTVDGTIAFGSPAFDLTFGFDSPGGYLAVVSGEKEHAFSDGKTVWMTIPPYLATMPGPPKRKGKDPLAGKKYVSSVLGQEDAGAVGMMSGEALGFSIGDAPDDVLSYLDAVGTATAAGHEVVDGQPLDRFEAQLDLDALQRALPSDAREFDAYDFKVDVPHTFPATVLLDAAGRLRRLTYRLDLATLLTPEAIAAGYTVEECPTPSADDIAKMKAGTYDGMSDFGEDCPERQPRPEELVMEGSVELSDYGTPLAVTAPPAAEVLTEDELDTIMQSRFDSISLKP
jgi:hypothetical protein